MKQVTTALFAISMPLIACSAAEGTLEEEAAHDAVIEDVGTIASPLSSGIACGEADLDVGSYFNTFLYPPNNPKIMPGTYTSKNGCHYAAFLAIARYRFASTQYNYFEYAGAAPTTAAACLDTRLVVYVFERHDNGSTTYVDDDERWGVPRYTNGVYTSCSLPKIYLDEVCYDQNSAHNSFTLPTDRLYHFAVSARTNNSGTPIMQAFKMDTKDQVHCAAH